MKEPPRNLDIARCEQQIRVTTSDRYREYLERALKYLRKKSRHVEL